MRVRCRSGPVGGGGTPTGEVVETVLLSRRIEENGQIVIEIDAEGL